MDIGIISIIISISFGVVTMTTLVGSTFYWAGRMANRIDAQSQRLDELGAQLGQRLDRQGERLEAHGERLAALGAEVAVLGVRIDALSAEVSTTRQELLAAISHHEHDTDGSVRFWVPPPA